MAAADRGFCRRTTGVLIAVLALAALAACTSEPSVPRAAASSQPAPSAAEPTPSRFASVTDVDPCGILTDAEQRDLVVHPGQSTLGDNFDSCGWLARSGGLLFTVSLWKRSASDVVALLSEKSIPPLTTTWRVGEVKPTSVDGRPALEYRRQSEGEPLGACGVFLVADSASSVQIEWHAGSPCEDDETKEHWDQVRTAIESKLPPHR